MDGHAILKKLDPPLSQKYRENIDATKRTDLDDGYNGERGVWLYLDSGGDLILHVTSECSGTRQLILYGERQSAGVVADSIGVDNVEYPVKHVLDAVDSTHTLLPMTLDTDPHILRLCMLTNYVTAEWEDTELAAQNNKQSISK